MSATLYRFWSERDHLLYVGITGAGVNRWVRHSKDKPWWTMVANVTVEHHPTIQDARAAEVRAIVTERPRFNIAEMGRTIEVEVIAWARESCWRCLERLDGDPGQLCAYTEAPLWFVQHTSCHGELSYPWEFLADDWTLTPQAMWDRSLHIVPTTETPRSPAALETFIESIRQEAWFMPGHEEDLRYLATEVAERSAIRGAHADLR